MCLLAFVGISAIFIVLSPVRGQLSAKCTSS